jgi:hypothetical protein
VADGVEFVGRDPRSNRKPDCLDRAGGDAPGLPDELDLRCVVNVRPVVFTRTRPAHIFGPSDLRRHRACRGDSPRVQVSAGISRHRLDFIFTYEEQTLTEWFYNIKTGEVEEGRQSIASELDGPFASKEEAANAPAIIAERSRKWAEDDAKNS